MNNKVRLGPFVLFFALITIILTVLALLDFSTTQADEALAKRYADVTKIKYELEKRGGFFLRQLDETNETADPEKDGIYTHVEQNNSYTLTIDYVLSEDGYDIRRWQITRDWKETNIFDKILQ